MGEGRRGGGKGGEEGGRVERRGEGGRQRDVGETIGLLLFAKFYIVETSRRS